VRGAKPPHIVQRTTARFGERWQQRHRKIVRIVMLGAWRTCHAAAA
jgi:hypothetical protein